MSAAGSPIPSAIRLAALRRQMAALDQTMAKPLREGERACPLGLAAVDASLPHGGLARGHLHEVIAADGGAGAAATGFAATLLARLGAGTSTGTSTGTRAGGGMALWCLNRRVSDGTVPYGPGLAAFGLRPERLILARVRRDADALWVLDEALRHPGFAAVLAETRTLDLALSRRLQLAAESTGVTGLVLRPWVEDLGATAAATRWRVTPRPMRAPPAADAFPPPCRPPRWQIELLRCRGGAAAGPWIVEWHHEAHRFALAAGPADGSDRARAAKRAV